jgi:isopentenyl-diphosphate delta-isomerase
MDTEHEPKLIYVVDTKNRPLAALPVELIHEQNLRHRGFFLLLTDRQNRLVLRKLSADHPSSPGRWDIPGSGHVGMDEAADQATERTLPAVLRDQNPALKHHLRLENGVGTGNEIVDVFTFRIPDQALHHFTRSLEYLLVDQNELRMLATSYRKCLTANLIAVWDLHVHDFGEIQPPDV